MPIPVLEGSFVASEPEVDVNVLDEDGKIVLGVLSRFEGVRLGRGVLLPCLNLRSARVHPHIMRNGI